MITKHGKAVAKLVPARPRRPASERVEVIREILAVGTTVKATPYTGRVATRRGLPLATHDASLALTGGASMGSFAELAAGTVTVNGGNVTLAGGGGTDAYALIHAFAGNLMINAPTGMVSLTPGAGTNANAAVVASLGTAQVLSAGCTGCTPLLVNPITGPSLLASGIFGSSGAVISVVPVIVVASAAAASATSPISICVGVLDATTGACNPPTPPPPQVLPPPAEPPVPDSDSQPASGTSTETAGGTSTVDDGSGARKKRAPRCG